jgi:hypothetical protein
MVWVGDLARALGELEPRDDTTRSAIAAVLGLAPPGDATTAGAAGRRPDRNAPGGRLSRRREATSTGSTGEEAGPPAAALAMEIGLIAREEPAAGSLSGVHPLAQRPIDPPGEAVHHPLFRPRWTRGVLTAALSTDDENGPVDVDRLTEQLARAEAPAELPRRRWPTMRHGVQLLVDVGEGMLPYAHDQDVLTTYLRAIVGAHRVATRAFRGTPLEDPADPAESRWTPPRPGTPIALLTDLGIARPPLSMDPAPVGDWLRFADEARRALCPVVAFVPYRSERVPMPLRRAISVVQWDRRTTANRVRAEVGRPLGRPA